MNQCALCALALPNNPHQDGGYAFCCSGCLTVFRILGSVDNFREHPLFQEALKAGVIANPLLVEEANASQEAEEQVKCHVQIEGMWCPSCADAIRLIMKRRKGIVACVVDYATDLGAITFNPKVLSKTQVLELINKMGYTAHEFFAAEKSQVSRALWVRFAVAAFCAMNIMMFSYPLYTAYFGIAADGYELTMGWLCFALSLPLMSYAAWPIWKRLNVSFKSGLFGMETLVLIGVSTAFAVSTFHLLCKEPTYLYFDSMSMVLTLVLLGKILERRAKCSAKETLLRLTRCVPKKGYKRLATGEYAYIPLKEIVPGDILMARTGEKIVLDGVVSTGEALVDEAVMTGEARLARKTPGSAVVGGSVVKQGSLCIKVTKDQTTSLLGQILAFVEHDLVSKNTPERIIDQITRLFVPTVLLLALIMGIFAGPLRALVILLISCPCALGIAAPLAQSRLLYLFAEKGALVRNRARLYLLAQNPLFAFDKTGTLTEGKFQVLRGLQELSEAHQSILKGLVMHSTHPISMALLEALEVPFSHMQEVQEIVGRGMMCSCQGHLYWLGSEKFMQEKGITVTCNGEETTVYFAQDQLLLAQIHFGDRIRERLPQVEGVILSGDSHALVGSLAHHCGFRWGKGGLDPLQKREEILALKKEGRSVVMVGDGVNDAPAMAAADLGISVVSATDLAVEVSDILLTTEHLDALPHLCTLTRSCRSIIYQNLFWAFFYNSVGILLACMGLLNPLFAAIAMAASSLCVTLNSLRLR